MKSNSHLYKAFVSSTFIDLKDHRAHVISELRTAGFFVDPMENWTADSDEPKRFSRDRLAGCDLCVLLMGFRRGFMPDGEIRSITQLEYDEAIALGIDVLVLQLDDNAKWWAKYDEREKDPEVKKWRQSLGKKHGVEFFTDDPRSISMMGSLARWLTKKNGGRSESEKIQRIDWPRNKSPYPGLEWFDEEYAPLFFGRDREVTQLVGKLSEPGGRFLVISGASGAGKSSLVAAGLWQALIKEGRLSGSHSWKWLRITPAADSRGPFASLAAGLHHTFPKLTILTEALTHALANEPTVVATHILSQLSPGQELVLVVDQLEELFTQASPSVEGRSFLDRLVALCGDRQNRLRVVATIRGEFFGQLAESESVTRAINEGFQMLVRPMELAALRDMIQKPAAATGYVFEPELADAILRDAVKEPGNLPLVAYALKQLFEQRQGTTFTLAAYQDMNGIVGAIEKKAEQVIAMLGQEADTLLDKVFAELVQIERDRPPTPKRARLSQFQNSQDARKTIRLLAGPECRVLMTTYGDSGETVEISHEALICQWPRLREWLNESREFLLWRERLRARMSDPQYNPDDEDMLLRGAVLVEAQRWLSERADILTGEEQSYIGQSVRAQERAAQAKQQRDDYESVQAKRLAVAEREKQWQRRLSWALLCFLGLGLIDTVLLINDYTTRHAFLKIESFIFSIHVPPQMVEIPGGTFQMGDVEQIGETWRNPVHPVRIKPFAMSKYEVTFEEYDRFAIETGRDLPNDQKWGRGQLPVINVSWDDAKAYAVWLSMKTGKIYRLPTESEWEYVARSGSKQEAWAGTSEESHLKDYAVFAENSDNKTARVGTKQANAFGLYDLSGNVWEWVEDCPSRSYKRAPTDGSAWTEGDKKSGKECNLRVIRGGSWSLIPEYLSVSYRFRCTTGLRSGHLGFRLVQDLEP